MALQVLHIVESLVPEAGSVATCLRGLPEALSREDIKSDTLSADSGNGQADVAERIAGLVEQAEVVHIHGWGHALARRCADMARRSGTPYLISPHGALGNGMHHPHTWREKLRRVFRDNRLVRRAAAVTALNQAEEDELRAQRSCDNVVRLPYGMDTRDYDGDAAAPPSEALAGRSMLVLGPIHPVEGLVPLLRAFSEIGPASNGWNIVVAGRERGDWRKMLEAAVRRKGGEGRVLFTDAPDVASQRGWLGRASLLAAPSLRVRLPVSVMQAILCGVPVLATSLSTPPDAGDAVAVCGATRSELKSALRKLLEMSDESLAARGESARTELGDRWNWSVAAANFARLYRSLPKKRTP